MRFTRSALADLAEALDYAETHRGSAYRERLRSSIWTTLDRLGRFPESARPGRVAGTREAVVLNTPYIVAYRAMSEEIQILAFRHSSQKWPEHFSAD